METVGDLVGKVLGDLGLDGVAVAHRIGSQWDEIVGPAVAKHCRPRIWPSRLVKMRRESFAFRSATLGSVRPPARRIP
ncbi:MAG: DciA family protein [bacterium]